MSQLVDQQAFRSNRVVESAAEIHQELTRDIRACEWPAAKTCEVGQDNPIIRWECVGEDAAGNSTLLWGQWAVPDQGINACRRAGAGRDGGDYGARTFNEKRSSCDHDANQSAWTIEEIRSGVDKSFCSIANRVNCIARDLAEIVEDPHGCAPPTQLSLVLGGSGGRTRMRMVRYCRLGGVLSPAALTEGTTDPSSHRAAESLHHTRAGPTGGPVVAAARTIGETTADRTEQLSGHRERGGDTTKWTSN
jgi:hypothetical protein